MATPEPDNRESGEEMPLSEQLRKLRLRLHAQKPNPLRLLSDDDILIDSMVKLEIAEGAVKSLQQRNSELQANYEMALSRMDWTVDDNAKKAIQIADLQAQLSQVTQERDEFIKDLKRGSCWCEVGIGNPNMTSHSEACLKIQKMKQGQ